MSATVNSEKPEFCRFKPEWHCNNVLQAITRLRSECILTDIVLVVKGRELPAHKNVLAAASDYFKAMFSSHIGNSETKVQLKEVTYTAVDQLVDYMYRGEIDITEENVEDILVASRLFLLDTVTQACCKFTQDRISVNNCWGIRNMADKLSLGNLLQKVNAFIEDNFSEAKGSDEFVELPFELMKELMADDELNIREDELVSAVLKWVEYDRQTRNKYLVTLFKLLRLRYISREYMAFLCEQNKLVSSNPFLVELIKTVYQRPSYTTTVEALISQEEFEKISKPRKWQRIVPVLTAVGGAQTLFYNTEEKLWVQLSPITTRHCPGLASIGCKMYLVGGSREWIRLKDCEMFTPETDSWTNMAPMRVARSNMGLVVLEGFLYAVGGYDGNTPTRVVERYNPTENQWSFVAQMNNLRDGACVVSNDTYIYAVTGFDGNSYLDTMEVYDPSEDLWRTEGYAPVCEKRQDAMSAYVDGMIYIIGGYQNQDCMSSGEVYDVHENTWSNITPMCRARTKAGCAVLNRKIYICGGWEGSGMVLTSVEFYDTELDTWTSLPPLPTPSAMRATFVYFPRKQVDKLTTKSKGKKPRCISAIITSASG